MLTSCLVFLLCLRCHILRSTQAERVSLSQAPTRPLALVLGAKVWGERPSHMLEDRLSAALELYRSARCESILLTGGPDEVVVMQAWLEARGVPRTALLLDGSGLRTFDSMARASRLLDERRVLVVTQDFHLPRAVYLARELGLEPVGVVAPANYRYPAVLKQKNRSRERLARVRAWLDLRVLETRPLEPDAPIIAAVDAS